MRVERVTVTDDSRLNAYRDVRGIQELPSGRFIVEGKWLVRRLLESKLEVESLLVAENHEEEFQEELTARGLEVPLYVGDWALLRELVGYKFHRGAMACGTRPPNPELSNLLRGTLTREPVSLVVCIGVQDRENLGGILRNASAFGVDGVLVGGHSASVYSRRVLRVSMGTVFNLPIRESRDLAADLQSLASDHHVTLVGTALSPESIELSNVHPPSRFALMFGNEANGLDHSWLELCHQKVQITMQHGTDSLNVATTSGVFLYHYQNRAGRAAGRE